MSLCVSVIVLTYNRSEALLLALRSLATQCHSSCEVIIADDGSTPEHVQRLHEGLPPFACRVRHVWHPDVGFAAGAARNLAAQIAEGDYLIFLDGDCIPHSGFIAQHLRLREPRCFVNGSRVLLSQRLTQQCLDAGDSQLLTKASLAQWLLWRWRGDVNKSLWRWFGAGEGCLSRAWAAVLSMSGLRDEARFRWRGIRSCNFALWRSDFLAVNGFDETFNGWGHEDADLVHRLHLAGLRRKNGFWATEVFHLWHPESPRQNEAPNRKRLEQRIRDRAPTLAETGVESAQHKTDVRIAALNGVA